MVPAAGMPGWVMLAFPVMMVVTSGRAVITAARRPGGRAGSPALVLTGIGAVTSALLLWSENIVLSLGGDASSYFGALLPWLLADLVILGIAWAGIARALIQLARRYGGGTP